MFKKLNEFLYHKAETWPEDKFLFVFLKLPIILLMVYALIVTAFAVWSFSKNLSVAKDFLKMEESCDRLLERQRQQQRYQTQYRREQLQRQYRQTVNAAAQQQ